MQYDHIIPIHTQLDNTSFHLSCGYYTATAFLFEQAGFAAVIDCSGMFLFYTPEGKPLGSAKAKPMHGGRGCYMDILLTTDGNRVIFRLPEYSWWDNFPHCDGESDRWDADIIGIRDEVVFPL